ncbi:MAG: PEP-utilizing enzyme, partial [Candidatus Paceibacterota bacterium]
LKDGDEIEVDANKGIVKIVNKNIKKYKINNQEIFLEKQHTRDLSLLKLSTWMYFDLHGLKEEIGVEIKNTVFYFNGEYVKVYYHMPSLNEVFNAITILCKDQNKIDSIFVRIKDLFNKIYPYLNRDKEIKSFKDLEYFYKTYKSYWKLLALIFVIPNLPDISQKIKNNSLKFREKVQSYPADSIFIDGLSQVFPKLSKKEIKVLSKNEIFGNKEIYKQELKKRLQGYIYYEDNLYVGDEMDDLIKEKNFIFNDEVFDSSNVDSLKGVVGFSGKVKGKCKVCMTANEINKVKEGDIIVSPMTTPDFLPAMKKALAFVTDEGGVTCHAAIVAREMKKPCIIGTKFATEVLKDGDEIEVDANKGIVKIINKNNE